ncbi:RNA polymerase sigma factor RpoH [Fundidesulfovibrio magnetotacticus]|uniref:RNA polymerase sigma factor n=1 Tax=Fundidesulfovibrio magnetotacticus TaxID=2730080 RepID=A0A6V8LSQ0_9BACT|nr:RNA polymerase factor sigma-32 [Fundidesulfovibrio magnetotacticus]GFK95502.1 RNA polymerase sigma factor RpoH [Fundidesulfovibrio magnetotacticus]
MSIHKDSPEENLLDNPEAPEAEEEPDGSEAISGESPEADPDSSGDDEGLAALPVPKLSAALASGRDNLHVYLREVSKFPLLAPDEEFELARQVRDHGDQRAAFRLVTSHLRLVVKIAMDFQRRWAQNVADLIQEGNVGLMRAVKKYDPEKGIKFSYYAAYWIKAYILKYIMDNWRLVRIGTTQAQRTLFYNLNKERQRLTSLGFDPSVSNISKNLKVSESDVLEMDQRMARGDLSLDISLGDDSTSTRLDYLPALTPGIEDMLAKDEISELVEKHLQTIMPALSDKERDLLEQRILSDSPMTLREIGAKYGITRERVRQIETRLLDKIRDHFTKRIGDFSSEWIRKDE